MLKSVLISLTSVLVCLLVTEAGLRAYYSYRLDYQIEMCRYAAKVKRSGPVLLSHDHLPNSSAHLMGVDVAINSHGFRDQEYPAKKPPDVFRIMLLGDSLTFGWGADANCRFGNVLERDLNAGLQAQGRSTRVQVVNTGVGNYNTSQEVTFFKERGLEFEPDLVVLNYFINDAEPTTTKGSNPAFKYSYLAMWLWGRVDTLDRTYFTNETYDNYYTMLYDNQRPGWQAATRSLGELVALQRERKFALAMAILPELHAVGANYGFAAVHDKVSVAAKQAGIEHVVDLAPNFADERNPESLWVSPDDAHPNCKAHTVIAHGLTDYLTQSSLVR